jgi:hypothetical protein
MIRSLTLIIGGIILGIAGTVGVYFYANRQTEVWTTTAELVGKNGMKIPAGTPMFYDASMSEGFYRAKIYINLTVPTTDQKIKKSISKHPFFVSPIWAY